MHSEAVEGEASDLQVGGMEPARLRRNIRCCGVLFLEVELRVDLYVRPAGVGEGGCLDCGLGRVHKVCPAIALR